MTFFHEMIFDAIAIALIVMIFVAAFIHARLKIASLRNVVQERSRDQEQSEMFLQLFAQNFDKMNDADYLMDLIARYLAESVGAQSLCFFDWPQNDDGTQTSYLKPSGVYGIFPMFITEKMTAKAKFVADCLRNTRLNFPTDKNEEPGILIKTALEQTDFNITSPKDERVRKLRKHMLEKERYQRAVMVASMVNGGKCFGVAVAIGNKQNVKRPFSSDQFNRFKKLSNQVVLAQQVLRTYQSMNKQKQLQQELAFAQKLQRSLLPEQITKWGNFEIHAFTRSSREISGDYYDFVELNDGKHLLVIVGDASGKGIRACMISAMVRSYIRAQIVDYTSLKDLFTGLNDYLNRDLADGSFITLCGCLLNKEENTAEYIRAGHTDLLMYVRNHMRVVKPTGSALGAMPSDFIEDFDVFCIGFQPDMAFMLYTDGISEAMAPITKEQYGQENIKRIFLENCCAGHSAENTVDDLIKSVDDFTFPSETQNDDQTVVVIRRAKEKE